MSNSELTEEEFAALPLEIRAQLKAQAILARTPSAGTMVPLAEMTSALQASSAAMLKQAVESAGLSIVQNAPTLALQLMQTMFGFNPAAFAASLGQAGGMPPQGALPTPGAPVPAALAHLFAAPSQAPAVAQPTSPAATSFGMPVSPVAWPTPTAAAPDRAITAPPASSAPESKPSSFITGSEVKQAVKQAAKQRIPRNPLTAPFVNKTPEELARGVVANANAEQRNFLSLLVKCGNHAIRRDLEAANGSEILFRRIYVKLNQIYFDVAGRTNRQLLRVRYATSHHDFDVHTVDDELLAAIAHELSTISDTPLVLAPPNLQNLPSLPGETAASDNAAPGPNEPLALAKPAPEPAAPSPAPAPAVKTEAKPAHPPKATIEAKGKGAGQKAKTKPVTEKSEPGSLELDLTGASSAAAPSTPKATPKKVSAAPAPAPKASKPEAVAKPSPSKPVSPAPPSKPAVKAEAPKAPAPTVASAPAPTPKVTPIKPASIIKPESALLDLPEIEADDHHFEGQRWNWG